MSAPTYFRHRATCLDCPWIGRAVTPEESAQFDAEKHGRRKQHRVTVKSVRSRYCRKCGVICGWELDQEAADARLDAHAQGKEHRDNDDAQRLSRAVAKALAEGGT